MSTSLAIELCMALVSAGMSHAHLDSVLDDLTLLESAALRYDWRAFWARPEQVIPDGTWLSYGFLTGRGFGKTWSCANFVLQEIKSGRARRVGCCAQSDDETMRVMIAGEAGLIAESPPWFRPEWYEKKRELVWTNGARAIVYTPETPGAIRGSEHQLFWSTEFVAWPAQKREEALLNIEFSTRGGYAKHVWDTTPKRKHPIVKDLLDRAARAPESHVIVRGKTIDNRHNIDPRRIADLQAKYGGTQKGREELEGEFLGDLDGAIFKQAWIDRARADVPLRFRRRVLACDPAISVRRGTDATGIVLAGEADGGRFHVIADLSEHYAPEEWGPLLVREYVRHRCDCLLIERNRGGDLCVSTIRAAACDSSLLTELGMPDLRVVVVQQDSATSYVPGVVYVKELISRTDKETRADPVAALYEQGRVAHPFGDALRELEDELTTWEPAPKAVSPNRLDAVVFCLWELAGLSRERPLNSGASSVLAAARAQKLVRPTGQTRDVSGLLAKLGVKGKGGMRI